VLLPLCGEFSGNSSRRFLRGDRSRRPGTVLIGSRQQTDRAQCGTSKHRRRRRSSCSCWIRGSGKLSSLPAQLRPKLHLLRLVQQAAQQLGLHIKIRSLQQI